MSRPCLERCPSAILIAVACVAMGCTSCQFCSQSLEAPVVATSTVVPSQLLVQSASEASVATRIGVTSPREQRKSNEVAPSTMINRGAIKPVSAGPALSTLESASDVQHVHDLPISTVFASQEAALSNEGSKEAHEPSDAQAKQMQEQAAVEAHRIDFATALALAAGQNPQVSFAQERINEALAQGQASMALWLPSLRAGTSYNKHEGSIQEVGGNVFDVSRASTYTGFGAQAVGTGSPAAAGISAQFHIVDAVFQPLIAERTIAARRESASATTNDTLLRTALAYLDLLRVLQERVVAEETLRHSNQLVELTTAFANTGQGPQADADRARAELAIRRNDVERSIEAIGVASARLAEVLSIEASLELRPVDPAVAPIELVGHDRSLSELITTALGSRPELAESRQLVCEAIQRFKREKFAPFVPSVLLGMSYGGFGGAPGSSIDNYRDRLDFDAVAFWEVRNLGFGEQAARDLAHARVHQATSREIQMMDQVAREVAEGYAQLQSRQKRIAVAAEGIETAQASYTRNFERVREGQGLPIEVLQAIQALDQAQREYLRSLVDYNESQFRLHRAIGWPAQ